MKKRNLIISLIVLIILIAGGVWFGMGRSEKVEKPAEQVKTSEQGIVKTEKTNQEQSTLDGLIEKMNPIKIAFPDISRWQTYYDNENGFEIKIPKDWYVEKTKKEGFFCLKSSNKKFYFEGESDVCGITIDTNFLNTYHGKKEKFVESFMELQKKENAISEAGYIDVNNNKYLYFSGTSSMPTVLIERGEKILEIKIQAAESTSLKDNVHNVLFGIIQTFNSVN